MQNKTENKKFTLCCDKKNLREKIQFIKILSQMGEL
jgi:hypothetical protein